MVQHHRRWTASVKVGMKLHDQIQCVRPFGEPAIDRIKRPSMPNTQRILVVDDDPELRDALTEQLSLHEKFEVLAAENGSKGVQAAKAGQIDLVIMDVGLPDIDGREAVRILRKNGFKAPIIMLTGHDTDSDTILGLDSGANDYQPPSFCSTPKATRFASPRKKHRSCAISIAPASGRYRGRRCCRRSGATIRD